jgi:hypothetical protein
MGHNLLTLNPEWSLETIEKFFNSGNLTGRETTSG